MKGLSSDSWKRTGAIRRAVVVMLNPGVAGVVVVARVSKTMRSRHPGTYVRRSWQRAAMLRLVVSEGGEEGGKDEGPVKKRSAMARPNRA